MDFNKFTNEDLRQTIRNYNLHYHIKNWSDKTRDELITIIKHFMKFVNKRLVNKINNDIEIPKLRQRKQKVKKNRRNTPIRAKVKEEPAELEELEEPEEPEELEKNEKENNKSIKDTQDNDTAEQYVKLINDMFNELTDLDNKLIELYNKKIQSKKVKEEITKLNKIREPIEEKHDELIKKYVIKHNIHRNDIRKWYYEGLMKNLKWNKKFWEKEYENSYNNKYYLPNKFDPLVDFGKSTSVFDPSYSTKKNDDSQHKRRY